MDTIINNILEKPLYSLNQEEYKELRSYACHFTDSLNEKQWVQVIIRAFDEVQQKEGKKEALDLIRSAYSELEKTFPQLFEEKSRLLKRECMFCLKENDDSEAFKSMGRFLYNALAQVHYCAKNARMPYYSFRGFSDYSLDDIKNETISLAHPREFNDPLDTIMAYWLDERIKRNSKDELELRYRLLMKKVAEHIKIRCLIAGKKDDGTDIPIEDLNVLMWAHYADSHRGFCVKYFFEDELFDRRKSVNSEKILLIDRIRYVESIKLDNEPSIKTALLEKSDFWKDENEMRLISFDYSGKDKDFPTVECKGAAKAIYLGARCSDSDRRKMEKAIGDKNILLYKMSIDESKLTRFKATLIG